MKKISTPPTPRLPAAVLAAMRDGGMRGKPLGTARADCAEDGSLKDTYLALTERELYLVRCEDAPKTICFAGTYLSKSWEPRRVSAAEVISLPLVTRADILNAVAGGQLVVTVQGEDRRICRFTGACARDMRRFCDELNRICQKDAPFSGKDRSEEDVPLFCPKCGAPYPERGRTVCPHCMKKHTVFSRVLSYFAPYKVRIAVMLLCLLLSGVFNAIWPYLSGTLLYDSVLGKQDSLFAGTGLAGQYSVLLFGLVLSMAGVKLLQQITGVLHGRMTAYMVPGVVQRLKDSIFASLQRLSVGFFNRAQTGSLLARANNDADEVMSFFIDGLPYLLFNVLTILLTAGVMFAMNWRLAIVAFALLPPAFLASRFIQTRLWHANGKRARETRSLYSVLNDNFTGARVVKAFGQEERENGRFSRANHRVRDAEMSVVRYRNQYFIAYSLAQNLPPLLVWSIGAMMLLNSGGNFHYGQLLTFVNYLSMLQGPIEFFSDIFQQWTNSMNAAERVFEIIDTQPEVTEKPGAVPIALKGRIELSHVYFSYEPNHPILKDISFTVQPGEMLGIVGRSGAGKSTLVNLISRLYDTTKGDILLDGVNVRDLPFESLRGAVAMVSQETYIFMGTIAQNIAYARPDASHEEIVSAAIASSAHSFICRLPDGYDTLIGTGGRKLSGGERQRISIARAILADPQILVLDEATASVDTETERAIQNALDILVKGRTTISIAHRLSTLRGADRLVVLENGELVEQGTHAQLVAQRGVYFKLLQLQSKALAMRGVGNT